MRIKRLVAGTGVGAVGLVLAVSMAPGVAQAAPGSPAGFVVARSAADAHKIQVAWKPVKGVDHYRVSLFEGAVETVKVVPATVTAMTLDAPDPCATYKVKVGARDVAEAGGNTGSVTVKSLAPGAVAGLTVARGSDRATAAGSWRAPTWPGYTPVTGYHVQVVRNSDKVVVSDQVSPELSVVLAVSRASAYTVAVSAQNQFGSCLTAKAAIANDLPGAPSSLTAVRDAGTPSAVAVGWKAPSTGFPVGYYRVGYGIGKITSYVNVNAPATSTVLSLDPKKAWLVQVQSFNEVAGSTAKSNTVTVPVAPVDNTAPVITAAVSAPANDSGWNNGPVTVTFTCSDAMSGLAGCSAPVTVSGDHAGQAVTGTATDKAGNSATTTATVNLDLTPPVITASVSRPANGAGWSNGAVTVTFTCADALSGIAVCPAPVTVSGDGAGQTVTGTALDRAGNTASATARVSLDQTAPTIAAAVSAPANGGGWNNGAVTIHYTCADALSGIVSCPADVTVDADGANQTITRTVSDVAGNTATAATTVNIDKNLPMITTVVAAANDKGWNNDDVVVGFTCSSALSGVASCTAPVMVTGDGANQVVTGTATDNAGNSATATATVNVDRTAPVVTGTVVGTRNAAGWYTGAVTVHFTCTDALSGVAVCPADVAVDADGAGQMVTRTGTDNAGNSATATVTVNVDRTAPTITPVVSAPANRGGWTTSAVTVHYTCTDAVSGVVSCPADVTVDADGANQAVTRTVTDNAGNSATATTTVNVDRTAPVVTGTVVGTRNAAGWYTGAVTVHFTCADAVSGVAACPADVTVDADGANQTVTRTGTDNAGNSATATVTVNVDRTAPTITAGVSAPANRGGWTTSAVTVHYSCTDAVSGVVSCPADVTVDADGANQAVTRTVTDKAGNSATATVTVNLDRTAPIITATVSKPATAASVAKPVTPGSWTNSAVTVHYTCTDAVSGIASCPADVTVSADGANQVVTGTTTDNAGNTAATTTTVNLDKTKPTITATVVGTRNSAGWYAAGVTIHYTCTDSVSGIATCPADVTVDADGANQTVTRTATDNAGNTTDVTITGLNIDRTAPTVALTGAVNAATYTLDAMPTPACQTTDATSGVATKATLTSTRNSKGGYTVTCSGGTDVAGNTAATKAVTYTVTPTAASLTTLLNTYLTTNKITNATLVSQTNEKLTKGRTCQYIEQINKEAAASKPSITKAQAAELIYWVTVLTPTCTG